MSGCQLFLKSLYDAEVVTTASRRFRAKPLDEQGRQLRHSSPRVSFPWADGFEHDDIQQNPTGCSHFPLHLPY